MLSIDPAQAWVLIDADEEPLTTDRLAALLRGCAQDVLAPRIARAAAAVLARRGVEVSIPPTQGCCGALALHAGDLERADAARGRAAATAHSRLGVAGGYRVLRQPAPDARRRGLVGRQGSTKC